MRGEQLYNYLKYPEQCELPKIASFENIEKVEVLQSPEEIDSFWFAWKAGNKWHSQKLPFGEIPEDEMKLLLVTMRLS